jgi:tRNA threonylcarbamoyladenosine biosynthesis protein TsaB
MLLLVVDTSGKNGSVSLARGIADKNEVEVIDVVPLTGGTFSAQLVPQIAALVQKHHFQKTDLGAYVAVSGPGSFTGLRVGLAAIKALAEISGKSIASVSLLEVVARSSSQDDKAVAVLDAGREELYVGDYWAANPISEFLISAEKFLDQSSNRAVVTPDRYVVERLKGMQVHLVGYPSIDAIARLGWERIRRGETVTPEALEANYIRRSDAEIFSKTK